MMISIRLKPDCGAARKAVLRRFIMFVFHLFIGSLWPTPPSMAKRWRRLIGRFRPFAMPRKHRASPNHVRQMVDRARPRITCPPPQRAPSSPPAPARQHAVERQPGFLLEGVGGLQQHAVERAGPPHLDHLQRQPRERLLRPSAADRPTPFLTSSGGFDPSTSVRFPSI